MQSAEHTSVLPQLTVAHDVGDFLRSRERDVEQIRRAARPSSRAALIRIWSAEHKNHRFCFATLSRMHGADVLPDRFAGVRGHRSQDAAIKQELREIFLDDSERRD